MRRMTASALAIAFGVMAAGPAHAVTFGLAGEFWDSAGTAIGSVTDAEAFIAGRTADATFTSTSIDYPSPGGSSASTDTLGAFLGSDAASLSGEAGNTLDGAFILRLTGNIALPAGNSDFSVISDDGFRLTIGGSEISAFDGLRSLGETAVTAGTPGGTLPIELMFFDGAVVAAGLELRVNGAIADTSILSQTMTVVPLPASALLLLSALGAGVLVTRRRA